MRLPGSISRAIPKIVARLPINLSPLSPTGNSSELQPLGRFMARLIADLPAGFTKLSHTSMGVHQCAHFDTIPAENDPRFFKYTSSESAIRSLKDKRLRWSSPDSFNDPFGLKNPL